MALSRVKTWVAEALLFVDLNNEFNNILDNALSLISPLTGNLGGGDNQINNVSRFGAGTASPSAPGHFTDEGSHTNTVVRNLIVGGTTSGTPAASIGTGILVQAESADENPSDFGALDFAASDVGAGTEDTFLSVLIRVAGRALDEKYRFSSTAGNGFAALFTHAVTADRTYTLPDATGTVALSGMTEITAATSFPSANTVVISSIPQGHSSLILTITGVSFDTAARALNIHANSTGGTYHQVHQYVNAPDDIVEASGDIARTPLDQAAAETATMVVVFTGYQSGAYTHASFVGQTRIGGTPIRFSGQGMDTTTTAMTSITLALSGTGNFDAGTYALHGVN